MTEFVMPSLGADMTAGTLIKWLKKTGDKVTHGDIIAEVDTDKGVIEVEVFTDGIIEKLLIEEGAKVPVGTVLAIIREEGEETKPSAEKEVLSKIKPVETEAVSVKDAKDASRLHASPVARKLADKLGVDLTNIKGTGPNGRIQREDVELAAKEKELKIETPGIESKSETDRSERMRRAIAAAMTRSKREIPHYYLGTTIDMSRTLVWLEKENARKSIKDRVLYNVLLLKAVALALKEIPELNAAWENDQLILKPKINVGVAISLRQGGLISPATFETDKQTPDELMKNLRRLVQKTRSGALRSSELSESSITVTNLGEQGVETVFGVIYPPQVALVGFGRIYEGVSVIEGRIKGSFKINATLAADHRATDGHRGSLFLAAIDRLLQEPEKL